MLIVYFWALLVGKAIFDYKYYLRGLDDKSDEYKQEQKRVIGWD